VLKVLIQAGKLDLKNFKGLEAKEFVEALLRCGGDGVKYLIESINGNKMPNLKLLKLNLRSLQNLNLTQFQKQESQKLGNALLQCGQTSRDCRTN
jgi:hypothetical protein